MLKGKWKLFICIALVTCVIFTASNDVFAAINDSYHIDTPVADANLDDKIKNSSLLEAIGSLIYAVGSLMEWCLGKVFQLITGTNMFPWADAILFNAVPFLDVNIFTAAGGSLVAILYDFLTGTYYSLLTLASTFFGIAVMFSAVKLAITAIAEDKAKYKKAIVDWLLGLVMLWGMHFFISFVLYLNEQLVVVASNIVSESTAKAGDAIEALSDTSSYNEKIVANFINLMEDGSATFGNWLGTAAKIIGVILIAITVTVATIGTLGVGTVIAGIVGSVLVVAGNVYDTKQIIKYAEDYYAMSEKLEEGKKNLANNVDEDSDTYDDIKDWLYSKTGECKTYKGDTVTYCPIDVAAALLKSDLYTDLYFSDVATDGSFWTLKKAGTAAQVARLYYDVTSIVGDIEINGETVNGYMYYKGQVAEFDTIPASQRIEGENYSTIHHSLYKTYCNIYEQYVLKQKSKTSVIYNLGTYFKETAFETSESGWKANKSVIQNAIMYVLLVCYSLVFFISYTKRLFYVIMLILMAPIVVVFDFFLKFGK